MSAPHLLRAVLALNVEAVQGNHGGDPEGGGEISADYVTGVVDSEVDAGEADGQHEEGGGGPNKDAEGE